MSERAARFVHLHNHTTYSLLDGAQRLDEMVARAAEDGQPAISITDHIEYQPDKDDVPTKHGRSYELATLLGPGVHTFCTRIFSKRVVPVLLGYDPLLQLLHPDDALDAMEAVLARGPSGVVNVVPRDAISLLTALHLSDKLTVAVPHLLAYPVAEVWWGTGVGEAPGGFIDYARFLFVADGEKARRELGFEARHGSRDALMAYLEYRYPTPPAGRGSSGHASARRRRRGRRRREERGEGGSYLGPRGAGGPARGGGPLAATPHGGARRGGAAPAGSRARAAAGGGAPPRSTRACS